VFFLIFAFMFIFIIFLYNYGLIIVDAFRVTAV
jgi:hypothetical protein